MLKHSKTAILTDKLETKTGIRNSQLCLKINEKLATTHHLASPLKETPNNPRINSCNLTTTVLGQLENTLGKFKYQDTLHRLQILVVLCLNLEFSVTVETALHLAFAH